MRMCTDIAQNLIRTLAAEGIVFTARHLPDAARAVHPDGARTPSGATTRTPPSTAWCSTATTRRAWSRVFSEALRTAYQRFLDDPLGAPLIPNWNRIVAAIPDFLDQLRLAVDEDCIEHAIDVEGEAPAMRLVIVTDLDGTLLDPVTYDLGPALEALRRVERAGIPLVLCSSKTRAEIEALQRRLGIVHPFISENGGAVVRPAGLLRRARAGVGRRWRPVRARARAGRTAEVVAVAARGRPAAERVRVVGFSDMTVNDVALDCGLPVLDAQLAKLRQYDEPFRLMGADPAARSRFLRALRRRGVRVVSGGRYDHATGDTDKGARRRGRCGALYAERRRPGDAGRARRRPERRVDAARRRPSVHRPQRHERRDEPRLLRKVPTARR